MERAWSSEYDEWTFSSTKAPGTNELLNLHHHHWQNDARRARRPLPRLLPADGSGTRIASSSQDAPRPHPSRHVRAALVRRRVQPRHQEGRRALRPTTFPGGCGGHALGRVHLPRQLSCAGCWQPLGVPRSNGSQRRGAPAQPKPMGCLRPEVVISPAPLIDSRCHDDDDCRRSG